MITDSKIQTWFQEVNKLRNRIAQTLNKHQNTFGEEVDALLELSKGCPYKAYQEVILPQLSIPNIRTSPGHKRETAARLCQPIYVMGGEMYSVLDVTPNWERGQTFNIQSRQCFINMQGDVYPAPEVLLPNIVRKESYDTWHSPAIIITREEKRELHLITTEIISVGLNHSTDVQGTLTALLQHKDHTDHLKEEAGTNLVQLISGWGVMRLSPEDFGNDPALQATPEEYP